MDSVPYETMEFLGHRWLAAASRMRLVFPTLEHLAAELNSQASTHTPIPQGLLLRPDNWSLSPSKEKDCFS